MKSRTETIIKAMRILSMEVHSDDGVANSAIAEAAERLAELQQRNAELAAQVEQLRYMLASATSIVIDYHDENISSEEAMNDLWQVVKKTPIQHLAEIKAQAVEDYAKSLLQKYRFNTVEYVVEYIEQLR